MPSKNSAKRATSLKKISGYFIPSRENNYRPKLLHPDFMLVLGFIAVGFFALVQTVRFFPSLQNSILGFQSSITIEEVVAQTNEKRQDLGLPPLTVNPQLSAAALAKAQDMLDNQYWAHTSPSGRKPWDFIKAANYHYKVAGENLARDFSRTNDMMRAWMDSPTHRANIMNERYEQIGVALVYGQLDGFDTALVVQMFGSPASGTAQVGDRAASHDDTSSAPVHNPVLAIEQGEAKEQPTVNLAEGSDVTVQTANQESRQTTGQKTVADSRQKTQVEYASVEQASAMSEGVKAVRPSIFTPLELTKVVFLAVVMMIVLTLIYDSFVIGNKKNMRLVGENFGHIILFVCVAFLMIIFKGGIIR